MTPLKRTIYVFGGILWFLFSLGFALLMIDYIAGGTGLQFFGGPVSSTSVLLGLVHLTGLATAIIICFAIGAGLCARGLVSNRN